MSAKNHTTELPGELHLFPPTGPPLEKRVAPIFAHCLNEHDVRDILILKRFPTGIETFTDVLANSVSSVERPEVMSLTRFARTILDADPRNSTLISQHERAAILAAVLSEYEWRDPFLQQASTFDAFEDDLGRFTLVAAWQAQDVDTDDSSLAELFEFTAHFQDVLSTNGYAERANIIPRALRSVEEATKQPPLLDQFDVLLTVEVEEFSALERRFLAAASTDIDVICVGERHGSIQRVRNEPKEITDHLRMETVDHHPPAPESGPAQAAAYLSLEQEPQSPVGDGLFEVTEATFTDQVETVAEEIEFRRTAEGWSYDEFAVVLKDSSSPIQETVRILQQVGIPTASVSTSALSDDPAARELYHVAQYLQSSENRDDQSRTLLEVRVPDFAAILDDEAATESISDALMAWVLDTDLKHRVGANESRLEASVQFQHISRILDLARFVEDCPLLESSWDAFCQALERVFRYSAPDFYSEVDVKEGGVLVDSARVVKNASWKAVFVLNVVEDEYPAIPRFSSLFPTTQLQSLPAYPAVTTPTMDDVHATFPSVDDTTDPFSAYYSALSRRLLAVGANAATDRVYLCTYAEDAADPGKYKQPSRFLQELRDLFEFDSITHDAIHSHGRAANRVLSSVDQTLQDVRTAPVTGEDLDLNAVESEFGAIQQLLDEADEPELEAAFEARVDFAAGRVRRD